MSVEQVTGVHLFPIKSAHEATVNGEYPTELLVSPTGFEANGVRDREFVVVDENGLFVTQRGWDEKQGTKFPRDKILAQVLVDIQADYLAVSAPDGSQLEVPISQKDNDHPDIIDIFGKPFQCIDMGYKAADFFSRLLGREVGLYRADFTKPRRLSPQYWRSGANNRMAGADGHPFLWTRQASLDWLHVQAGLEFGTKDIRDYRANIESAGDDPPFIEDYVREVVIGGLGAYVTKACDRCPIPNYNQQTGERDNLSNKLLARTRMGTLPHDEEGVKERPMFGENLNHRFESVGKIVRIGDIVSIRDLADEPNVVGLPEL